MWQRLLHECAPPKKILVFPFRNELKKKTTKHNFNPFSISLLRVLRLLVVADVYVSCIFYSTEPYASPFNAHVKKISWKSLHAVRLPEHCSILFSLLVTKGEMHFLISTRMKFKRNCSVGLKEEVQSSLHVVCTVYIREKETDDLYQNERVHFHCQSPCT